MASSRFSFRRRNHFGPRLPRCFRLRGHGSLKLYRKSDVLSEAETSVWYPFQAAAGKFMDEHASVIMNGVKTVVTTFTINIMTGTSLLPPRALNHFQKCISIFSISFSLQLIWWNKIYKIEHSYINAITRSWRIHKLLLHILFYQDSIRIIYRL